ncbi:MAG: hypothetical protein ACRD4I_12470, partial [Candidatus Angelobacter sp.]
MGATLSSIHLFFHYTTSMKVAKTLSATLIGLVLLSGMVFAQEGTLDTSQPTGVIPQDIIQHFASKEKEFKEARDQYT